MSEKPKPHAKPNLTATIRKTKQKLNILKQETNQEKIRREKMRELTIKHRKGMEQIRKILPKYKKGINRFLETFQKNRKRYEYVAQATGIPSILIAAIHTRESTQNFSCYLHNGEPLGKKTTKKPEGIYFKQNEWGKAAIHALGGEIKDNNGKPSLNYFQKTKNGLQMNETTIKIPKMMAFAEKYNGLGYHNNNKLSPYIYSGTNLSFPESNTKNEKFPSDITDENPGIAALLLSAKKEKLI